MALVTTTEMFKKAYHGGYAVGAFNVNNMEIVQGITEAAGELKSPVILQVSKGARAYANHTYLVKLVEAAVIENPEIPIALHLDHGDSFELCKSCIDGGFTSVMIDASSKSFEENIALTKQVVEYAHAHGVVVEAELGTLAGIEDEVVVESGHESYPRPRDPIIRFLPVAHKMPVAAGVFGIDPTRDMDHFLDELAEIGFSGIINYPTVGKFTGKFREEIESVGLGYEREAAMLQLAHEKGFLTIGYVYTEEDARTMALG